MEGVMAYTREHGLRRLDLSVWAFNESALAFYGRLGFRPYLLRREP
jgi:ribosomal protein S18 acetylase RimI-like enzyme